MPRVRPPAAASVAYAESPVKKVQIPLNDDDEEKAQRLHSRKLAASRQRDDLRAAASPARRPPRTSLGAGAGPATPSPADQRYGDVAGTALTPMQRVPILANFEEWMKMATDNKINAANSWNFALIDYFHDMSLLKDGDRVNFQKASCTLDGCVKIYTSRVDSVATETGKLLSGLADSGNNKKRRDGEAEGEDGRDDDDEEGEEGEGQEGVRKKGRKKANRSAEATLATSFAQLRLKKMDLEFSVDPLFKKCAADFDEGGAKGLLMNHLSMDSTGRIVFDSSDDVQAESEETRRDSMEPEGDEKETTQAGQPRDGPVDMAALGARFFPNLATLDEQDICPSLKTFELGSGDGSLDLPFLKAPENWREEHPEEALNHRADGGGGAPLDAPAGFDDDDDADLGPAFDMPAETGFGEGGEAWARDAALQPQMRVHDILGEGEDGAVGTFDAEAASYGVTLQHRETNEQDNILHYFDTALHKNWAGPEHWKIARIKQASKANAPQRVRREKEPFEIDFAAPMTAELANALATRASSNAQISLPRTQWRSKTRNLLPDDKHFNSKDLLKLFLKPKARLGARNPGTHRRLAPIAASGDGEGEVDEAYWATAAAAASAPAATAAVHPMDDDADDGPVVRGAYDADFFADDPLPLPSGADADDDDDGFADARDHFSPSPDAAASAGPDGQGIDSVAAGGMPGTDAGAATGGGGAFGVNLVTQSRRLRPEYVQYARVAKKVDIRRLKENMWKGIGFDTVSVFPPSNPHTPFSNKRSQFLSPQPDPTATPAHPSVPPAPERAAAPLHFSAIMQGLAHVYPRRQMSDISTSFGFICLLHLANEKGLVVENVAGWEDLRVRRDETATDLEVVG